MKRTLIRLAAIVTASITALGMAGCSGQETSSTGDAGDDTLSIFATTGYLADAAKNIAPDAEVITMVGPGGDPHTYEPSTQDIQNMKDADVVFWQGLHMEAQMLDQLASLGDKQLAVGDQLPKSDLLDWPETDDEGNALNDPHIWNSPSNWEKVVEMMGDHLATLDADNADAYKANAESYIDQIKATDAECQDIMSKIPDDRRVLVSGHDAFGYFGKTYNLEVYATDFVSSEAQKSPEEISELADLIVDKKVPVIFLDNLANPQAIESLKEAVHSRGWDVEVSEAPLYADSLGEAAPVDTYLGVLKYNCQTVSDALSK